MPITQSATMYVQAFFNRQQIEGGLAFRDALSNNRLDFTIESLDRIDFLLRWICKNAKPTEDQFLRSQENQNFLYFVAFYVGQVIARNSRARVDWYSFPEWVALNPHDKILGPAFYSSAICVFNQTSPGRGTMFIPLYSITEQLFEEHSTKSVAFSAQLPLGQLKGRPPQISINPEIDLQREIEGILKVEPAYISLKYPPWIKQDPLNKVLEDYVTLLRTGRVVWGRLVQGNMALYEPGDTSSPAEVVYDPAGMLTQEELYPVGERLYALKEQHLTMDPSDPKLKPLRDIGQRLAAETVRGFGERVPWQIYPGQLQLSTIFMYRPHLPGAIVNKMLLPIIVSNKCPGSTWVLPGRLWPQGMVDWWNSKG